MHKYWFSSGIITTCWNLIQTKFTAGTFNSFKARLDIFCVKEEFFFDCNTNISALVILAVIESYRLFAGCGYWIWGPFFSRASKAHEVAVISVSLSLSRTLADAARSLTCGLYIAWYGCLFPGFHWYLLTDPKGMACWVGVGTQQPRAGFEPLTSQITSPATYYTATTYLNELSFNLYEKSVLSLQWTGLRRLAVSALNNTFSSSIMICTANEKMCRW